LINRQSRLYWLTGFIGLAVLAGLFWLWSHRERTVSQSEFALGTIIEITVTGTRPEPAVASAFQEIRRIEKLTSSRRESDLGRINQWAGKKPVRVSPDTIAILQYIKKLHPLVFGAFDPTIAPLIELWGFGYDGQPHLPEAEQIRQSLALVDFKQVKINTTTGTVMLLKPGMRLDLGGIAKGYAIDRAYQILRRAGIKSALINGGSSSIRVIGKRADGQNWQIGIGHPRKSDSLVGRLTLPHDRALGTSADTQNFFIKNRVRYHHIINPYTGYPSGDKILVTVTASTAMTADLLSTAFFILPADRVHQAIKQLPGVRVIIVEQKQKVLNINEPNFQQ